MSDYMTLMTTEPVIQRTITALTGDVIEDDERVLLHDVIWDVLSDFLDELPSPDVDRLISRYTSKIIDEAITTVPHSIHEPESILRGSIAEILRELAEDKGFITKSFTIKRSILATSDVINKIGDVVNYSISNSDIEKVLQELINSYTRLYNQLTFDVTLTRGELYRQLLNGISPVIGDTVVKLTRMAEEVMGKELPEISDQLYSILYRWIKGEIDKELGYTKPETKFYIRSKWLTK